MPKVSVTINRSSKVIWDYFMTLENWRKWWGASISGVSPRWQNGARLTWENGDKSDLPVVRNQQEIQISSKYMNTAYYLKQKSKNQTLVEYEFNPCSGASFSDGGRGHKDSVEKKLDKLKDCIENETDEGTKSDQKKWWKFWE